MIFHSKVRLQYITYGFNLKAHSKFGMLGESKSTKTIRTLLLIKKILKVL